MRATMMNAQWSRVAKWSVHLHRARFLSGSTFEAQPTWLEKRFQKPVSIRSGVCKSIQWVTGSRSKCASWVLGNAGNEWSEGNDASSWLPKAAGRECLDTGGNTIEGEATSKDFERPPIRIKYLQRLAQAHRHILAY